MNEELQDVCCLCDAPAVGPDGGIGADYCHLHFIELSTWLVAKGFKAFEDDMLSGVLEKTNER